MSDKPNEPQRRVEYLAARVAYFNAAMACGGVQAFDPAGQPRSPLDVRDDCCKAISDLRKQLEKEERNAQRTDA